MEAQQQEQQENDESLTEEQRKAKAARDEAIAIVNGYVLKGPLEKREAKTALTALQRYAAHPASLSDAEAMDVIIRFTACACELGWGCGATIVTLVDYLKAKDNGDDDAAAAALEKMRRYIGVQNFLYSRDASVVNLPNILLEKMRLTCSSKSCANSAGGRDSDTSRQHTCDIVEMQRTMGVSLCAINAINDRGMDRKTFDQLCYDEEITTAFGASTCYVYNIHNGAGAAVAAVAPPAGAIGAVAVLYGVHPNALQAHLHPNLALGAPQTAGMGYVNIAVGAGAGTGPLRLRGGGDGDYDSDPSESEEEDAQLPPLPAAAAVALKSVVCCDVRPINVGGGDVFSNTLARSLPLLGGALRKQQQRAGGKQQLRAGGPFFPSEALGLVLGFVDVGDLGMLKQASRAVLALVPVRTAVGFWVRRTTYSDEQSSPASFQSILHPKYLALDPRRPECAVVADVTDLFVRRVLLNPGNITVVEDAKGKIKSPWEIVRIGLLNSVYARVCYEQVLLPVADRHPLFADLTKNHCACTVSTDLKEFSTTTLLSLAIAKELREAPSCVLDEVASKPSAEVKVTYRESLAVYQGLSKKLESYFMDIHKTSRSIYGNAKSHSTAKARKFIRDKVTEIKRELVTLTAGYFAELQRAIAFLLTRDEFQPRDAAEREQFAVVESYLANPNTGPTQGRPGARIRQTFTNSTKPRFQRWTNRKRRAHRKAAYAAGQGH